MPDTLKTLTAATVDTLAIHEPDKLLAMLDNKQAHDHVWELVATYGNDPFCADCGDPVKTAPCHCEHRGIEGLDVSDG